MGGRKRKRTADVRNRKSEGVATNAAEPSVPSTIRALVGAAGLVMTLPEFITSYAPSLPPLDLDGCTDGDRIRRTMVNPSTGLLPAPEIKNASRSQTLVDLVDEVIWSLVQRKSRDWSQRNALDQGYNASSSSRDHSQQCPNMRPGVVCTQINDNVTFCKTSSYAEALHRLLGDALMRTLLLHTSVFVPVEGSTDNFILLCGTGTATSKPGKQGKRKNCEPDNTDSGANGWKANDTISWQSLLYSQAYTPKVGFQTNHVMNQNDPNKLLGAIVNLYTASGKKRRTRWKRLRRGALPICEGILHRHAKFDYHRTLNRFCPLPDFAKQGIKVDIDLAEVGASHTSAKCVAKFLQAVIRKVLPLEFWGTQHNVDRVLSILATFVNLRRGERFPFKSLMDGLRVTDIRWMWAEDNSKSSHEAATALLRETMRWVVCGFTIPLLRSIFYVTESELFGKRVLYYRKPVWSIFRSLSIFKLTSRQYQEITQKQTAALLQGQQMGLSRLKLLPKATGVRPIAMLSRRDTLTGNKSESYHPSTNMILANTFRVLRHEYERNPHTFGSGQSGLDGVYTILKSFLGKVRSNPHSCSKMTTKKLYFVSVDIEKCYDNVNQQHLQGIIEDIVQQDQYLIQNYSVLQPFSSLGRPVWRPLTLVGGLKEYERFHKFSQRLSPQYTEAVFSNSTGCAIIKKQDIMTQLAEHLHRNLLAMPGRFGKRYFLQKSGIPQGSVLSSFLCNYYYGKMETVILGNMLENASESALIRIMDDFIFITTDCSLAEMFLERMKVGKPELGVCINEDKSLSNLARNGDDTKQMLSMSGSTFFSWCGWLFDTTTGEVRIDYSRFANRKALDALRIERRQVGRNLEIQMKAFVRPRCQPILFDAWINSFDVVVINFTQMMLLAALKSQEVIRSVIDIDTNIRFLRQTIEATVLFARNLIIRRLKQQAKKGTYLCFGEQEALWLGRYAFQWVFKRMDLADLSFKPGGKKRRSRLKRAAQRARAEFLVMTGNESQ